MNALFSAGRFTVRPVASGDVASTLQVYEQCEDFLSLGPVPKASRAMVLADIEHSAQAGGVYCGIWDEAGTQIGILDFVPEAGERTSFLSLLMISGPHRRKGLGSAVLAALESHLATRYGTLVLESGVQVSNGPGIAFWEKHGFRIDRDPRPMSDGTTAYAMSKRVSAGSVPASAPP